MRCDGSTLFLVTGNSGAGKDSVMKGASELCPGLHVAKRYITRPDHSSEDFVSLGADEFRKLSSEGFFCIHWESYGLSYGIPSEIDSLLENRVPVLVNTSRAMTDFFRYEYPGSRVVFISASLETIKRRLEERGREKSGSEALMSRLSKAEQNPECNEADCVIDNSGDLLKASRELCLFIAEAVSDTLQRKSI